MLNVQIGKSSKIWCIWWTVRANRYMIGKIMKSIEQEALQTQKSLFPHQFTLFEPVPSQLYRKTLFLNVFFFSTLRNFHRKICSSWQLMVSNTNIKKNVSSPNTEHSSELFATFLSSFLSLLHYFIFQHFFFFFCELCRWFKCFLSIEFRKGVLIVVWPPTLLPMTLTSPSLPSATNETEIFSYRTHQHRNPL